MLEVESVSPEHFLWNFSERVAIVAAHPDDEVIGAGGHLPQLRDAVFIHVTNGAPRNSRDAAVAGFSSPQEYARARAQELASALKLAGIDPGNRQPMGMVDQEASYHLCRLTRSLIDLLRENRTDVVLTHPYEGGHPDHDATAFSVRAACGILKKQGARFPRIVEFTSYHARDGHLIAGEFLPDESDPGNGEITVDLSAEMRDLKRRMFDCYVTQRHVLQLFPIHSERFRPAPVYHFNSPPHAGPLHYERFDWGITGEQWRGLAFDAARELGLD
ncbi:MAG: PIG-L family deacetylase [Acidobacteriota bacterium]|nr:PIG-L family deacetylase [Acidobacteriota bacterium]